MKCDVALPCATQNELNGEDAKTLIANGCIAVAEGANMPTDLDGVHVFKGAKILFAPGKAANAGGVAVSGLEMSQNSARISWKEEELQQLLNDIMDGIHNSCVEYGGTRGSELHRLCPGRQHRRLQEGGRRDAGLRGGLTGAASPARQRERDDAELTANVDCKVRGGSASPLCHQPIRTHCDRDSLFSFTRSATEPVEKDADNEPIPEGRRDEGMVEVDEDRQRCRVMHRTLLALSKVPVFNPRIFSRLRRLSSLLPIRSTSLSPAGRDSHVRPHRSWGSVTYVQGVAGRSSAGR